VELGFPALVVGRSGGNQASSVITCQYRESQVESRLLSGLLFSGIGVSGETVCCLGRGADHGFQHCQFLYFVAGVHIRGEIECLALSGVR